MAKKTTQMSLIKFYPKEKRHIETYPREKGGKIEQVSEHDKGVHVKPQLTKAGEKKVKQEKAKKLVKKIESIEDIKEAEKIKEPEVVGLSHQKIEKIIAEQNLVKSEAYKNWLKKETELKDLEMKYKRATDSAKPELQAKIEKLRDETNELYSIFRVIIEEEIVSENKQWEHEFYNQLSEADRYNFKTIEQLKKEEALLKTEKNPFFDSLFQNKVEADKGSIRIKLSENGDKCLLKWDNIGPEGQRKLTSYRDDYEDFISVVRDKYNGAWNKGSFIIEADVLDDVLKELATRNSYIKYHIAGEHNTQDDWEKHANIQKEVVIETESDNMIFEVRGNRVILKSGAKTPFEKEQELTTARRALNSAYSREIKKQVKIKGTKRKKEKKVIYNAVEINEKGEYEMPIGLLSKAYWLLKDHYDFDVAVSDTRPRNPISNPELRGLSLYNFQKKAVVDSLIEGQGLIVSPTGSGKTVIACGIISGFLEGAEKYERETGKKVDVDSLFLVHRGSLRDQAHESFKKFLPEDVNLGLLDSENFNPAMTKGDDINIGTIQGMYSALKKQQKGKILNEKDKALLKILRDAEVIFQDEAHHIVAESYDKVYDQNKSIHKFGLTATPSNSKQEDILRVMKIGDKRIPITYQEAQNQGILMKPNIIQIPIPTSPNFDMGTGGLKGNALYWARIRNQVEENNLRNDLIIDHAHRFDQAGKKVIIFTRTRRHANALLKDLKKQYPKTNPVLLHGKLKKEKIKQNQDKLAKGETNIAIGTDALLGEGFDLPTLDVILGAGSSQVSTKISVMQTAGRTMRVAEGKEQPIIIEYEDEHPSFQKRINKRRKNYKEYNAFDFTPIDTPEDYYTDFNGDVLCKTNKEAVEWVNKFLDPKESTRAEKFQTSEFYQHKRARGELKKEIKATEVIKAGEKTKRFIPHTERLSDLTGKQILDLARKLDVPDRSSKSKAELIRRIKYHNYQWDDKDRAIAREVATGSQTVSSVFAKAHRDSVEKGSKHLGLTPSEVLEQYEQEKKVKRVKF